MTRILTDEKLIFKWTVTVRTDIFRSVMFMLAKLFAFRGGGKNGEYGLYVEDDFKRGRTIKDLVKHLKPHSFARTIGLKL